MGCSATKVTAIDIKPGEELGYPDSTKKDTLNSETKNANSSPVSKNFVPTKKDTKRRLWSKSLFKGNVNRRKDNKIEELKDQSPITHTDEPLTENTVFEGKKARLNDKSTFKPADNQETNEEISKQDGSPLNLGEGKTEDENVVKETQDSLPIVEEEESPKTFVSLKETKEMKIESNFRSNDRKTENENIVRKTQEGLPIVKEEESPKTFVSLKETKEKKTEPNFKSLLKSNDRKTEDEDIAKKVKRDDLQMEIPNEKSLVLTEQAKKRKVQSVQSAENKVEDTIKKEEIKDDLPVNANNELSKSSVLTKQKERKTKPTLKPPHNPNGERTKSENLVNEKTQDDLSMANEKELRKENHASLEQLEENETAPSLTCSTPVQLKLDDSRTEDGNDANEQYGLTKEKTDEPQTNNNTNINVKIQKDMLLEPNLRSELKRLDSGCEVKKDETQVESPEKPSSDNRVSGLLNTGDEEFSKEKQSPKNRTDGEELAEDKDDRVAIIAEDELPNSVSVEEKGKIELRLPLKLLDSIKEKIGKEENENDKPIIRDESANESPVLVKQTKKEKTKPKLRSLLKRIYSRKVGETHKPPTDTKEQKKNDLDIGCEVKKDVKRKDENQVEDALPYSVSVEEKEKVELRSPLKLLDSIKEEIGKEENVDDKPKISRDEPAKESQELEQQTKNEKIKPKLRSLLKQIDGRKVGKKHQLPTDTKGQKKNDLDIGCEVKKDAERKDEDQVEDELPYSVSAEEKEEIELKLPLKRPDSITEGEIEKEENMDDKPIIMRDEPAKESQVLEQQTKNEKIKPKLRSLLKQIDGRKVGKKHQLPTDTKEQKTNEFDNGCAVKKDPKGKDENQVESLEKTSTDNQVSGVFNTEDEECPNEKQPQSRRTEGKERVEDKDDHMPIIVKDKMPYSASAEEKEKIESSPRSSLQQLGSVTEEEIGKGENEDVKPIIIGDETASESPVIVLQTKKEKTKLKPRSLLKRIYSRKVGKKHELQNNTKRQKTNELDIGCEVNKDAKGKYENQVERLEKRSTDNQVSGVLNIEDEELPTKKQPPNRRTDDEEFAEEKDDCVPIIVEDKLPYSLEEKEKIESSPSSSLKELGSTSEEEIGNGESEDVKPVIITDETASEPPVLLQETKNGTTKLKLPSLLKRIYSKKVDEKDELPTNPELHTGCEVKKDAKGKDENEVECLEKPSTDNRVSGVLSTEDEELPKEKQPPSRRTEGKERVEDKDDHMPIIVEDKMPYSASAEEKEKIESSRRSSLQQLGSVTEEEIGKGENEDVEPITVGDETANESPVIVLQTKKEKTKLKPRSLLKRIYSRKVGKEHELQTDTKGQKTNELDNGCEVKKDAKGKDENLVESLEKTSTDNQVSGVLNTEDEELPKEKQPPNRRTDSEELVEEKDDCVPIIVEDELPYSVSVDEKETIEARLPLKQQDSITEEIGKEENEDEKPFIFKAKPADESPVSVQQTKNEKTKPKLRSLLKRTYSRKVGKKHELQTDKKGEKTNELDIECEVEKDVKWKDENQVEGLEKPSTDNRVSVVLNTEDEELPKENTRTDDEEFAEEKDDRVPIIVEDELPYSVEEKEKIESSPSSSLKEPGSTSEEEIGNGENENVKLVIITDETASESPVLLQETKNRKAKPKLPSLLKRIYSKKVKEKHELPTNPEVHTGYEVKKDAKGKDENEVEYLEKPSTDNRVSGVLNTEDEELPKENQPPNRRTESNELAGEKDDRVPIIIEDKLPYSVEEKEKIEFSPNSSLKQLGSTSEEEIGNLENEDVKPIIIKDETASESPVLVQETKNGKTKLKLRSLLNRTYSRKVGEKHELQTDTKGQKIIELDIGCEVKKDAKGKDDQVEGLEKPSTNKRVSWVLNTENKEIPKEKQQPNRRTEVDRAPIIVEDKLPYLVSEEEKEEDEPSLRLPFKHSGSITEDEIGEEENEYVKSITIRDEPVNEPPVLVQHTKDEKTKLNSGSLLKRICRRKEGEKQEVPTDTKRQKKNVIVKQWITSFFKQLNSRSRDKKRSKRKNGTHDASLGKPYTENQVSRELEVEDERIEKGKEVVTKVEEIGESSSKNPVPEGEMKEAIAKPSLGPFPGSSYDEKNNVKGKHEAETEVVVNGGSSSKDPVAEKQKKDTETRTISWSTFKKMSIINRKKTARGNRGKVVKNRKPSTKNSQFGKNINYTVVITNPNSLFDQTGSTSDVKAAEKTAAEGMQTVNHGEAPSVNVVSKGQKKETKERLKPFTKSEPRPSGSLSSQKNRKRKNIDLPQPVAFEIDLENGMVKEEEKPVSALSRFQPPRRLQKLLTLEKENTITPEAIAEKQAEAEKRRQEVINQRIQSARRAQMQILKSTQNQEENGAVPGLVPSSDDDVTAELDTIHESPVEG